MDEHSVLLQPTACTDAVAAPPRYSPLPGAMVTLHRTAGPPGSHPAKIPFWPVTVETRPTCWARNTSMTAVTTVLAQVAVPVIVAVPVDRKSTRLNSSHV